MNLRDFGGFVVRSRNGAVYAPSAALGKKIPLKAAMWMVKLRDASTVTVEASRFCEIAFVESQMRK